MLAHNGGEEYWWKMVEGRVKCWRKMMVENDDGNDGGNDGGKHGGN